MNPYREMQLPKEPKEPSGFGLWFCRRGIHAFVYAGDARDWEKIPSYKGATGLRGWFTDPVEALRVWLIVTTERCKRCRRERTGHRVIPMDQDNRDKTGAFP